MTDFKAALLVWGFVIGWMIINIIRDRKRLRHTKNYFECCACTHTTYDPRPCKGQNGNRCVGEGCYGESCLLPEARPKVDLTKKITEIDHNI